MIADTVDELCLILLDTVCVVSYFPEIFNASGGPSMVKKYGDWFTYEHTPRANIFCRDHHKVTDMDSMMRLMRFYA